MTVSMLITPVKNIPRRKDPDVQVRDQNLVELKPEKKIFYCATKLDKFHLAHFLIPEECVRHPDQLGVRVGQGQVADVPCNRSKKGNMEIIISL